MASRFSSKQSASQTLPAYMRRRQNFPGPWLGGVGCSSIGPFDIAGGDATRRVATLLVGPRISRRSPASDLSAGNTIYIGHGRLLAVTWYCHSVSGAGPTLILREHVGPNSAAGFTNLLDSGTAIDLNALPSGVAYYDVGAPTRYLTHTDQILAAPAYTSPDLNHTSAGNSWIQAVVTGSGQTASNVCVTFWFTTTSHVNISPADD